MFTKCPHLLQSSRAPGGMFRAILVTRCLISRSRDSCLKTTKCIQNWATAFGPVELMLFVCLFTLFLTMPFEPCRGYWYSFSEKWLLAALDKHGGMTSLGSPGLSGIKAASSAADSNGTTQVLPSTPFHGAICADLRPQLWGRCLHVGRIQTQNQGCQ